MAIYTETVRPYRVIYLVEDRVGHLVMAFATASDRPVVSFDQLFTSPNLLAS